MSAGLTGERLTRDGRNLVHAPVQYVRTAVCGGRSDTPHRTRGSARSGPTDSGSRADDTLLVGATAASLRFRCRALCVCSFPADDASDTKKVGLLSSVSFACVPAPLLDITPGCTGG